MGEYEYYQEEWTEAEWQQCQQGQQQGQQPQQQQQPTEQAVAKVKQRMALDMTKKLDMGNLSSDLVVDRLRDIVKSSVDIDEDDEFDNDTPLMQVGVTSKTAVTLRNT